jgi:formylglycine-generating enzyme required for sulfatase activity
VPFPQATVLANVNSGSWHEFPRLTRDGLHLLFVGSSSGAPVNDQGLVIASREKVTSDFAPPQSLGTMFRTGIVSGPSLSGDDSVIYFSARRAGLTHHDLWVTRRVPKGSSGGDNTRVADADGLPLPAIAPFGSKAAREFQDIWAKHLNVEVETTNSIGMKLRLIPPGKFRMGAPDSDSDAMPQEKPQHSVTLTKPFFIGATEVTVAQFRKFVEATKYVTEAERDGKGAFDVGSKNRRPNYVWNKLNEIGLESSDDHPVRCVSWEDARQFCEWLGKAEGREYRLPTDAEWEFACRAGTQTRYSFGNEFDPLQVSGTNGSPLSPVAQFPANPFGLFDMHGNLNEICWDAGRAFTADAICDPVGPLDLSTPAVVRGGAVSSSPARLRSSQRYITDSRRSPESNFATYVKGFRVATSVESAMPQTKVDAQARLPKLELGEQLLSVKNAAGLKLGDLDGDGDLDLFVASLKGPCVVLLNDGRGHFTDSGQRLGDNASFAVALGDLDGDGDLDAFVCNSDDQEDAIWLNDGRGTFQRSTQSFPSGHSNDVALADVDGDKDLDVVVSNYHGNVTIWNNDGSGHFTRQQSIARIGNTGVALGDLDGDGAPDLVMTSIGGDNRVWLNDGQGHFTESEQQIELAKSTSVALGDLDRDGDLDLFITAHDGSQVWFNDGRGRFQASGQRLGDGLCEAVELVDLDADHDLDAVSIGGGFEFAKPRSVWRNNGQGRFAKDATTLKTGRSQALAVGDLDGDGDADVVLGNLAEPAEVWLNPSNQSTIP